MGGKEREEGGGSSFALEAGGESKDSGFGVGKLIGFGIVQATFREGRISGGIGDLKGTLERMDTMDGTMNKKCGE